MRLIIVLSFLAILCTVASGSTELEILRRQLRNLKWEVDILERQLELLRNQAEEDTIEEVILKRNEEQDGYRSFKALLISHISKALAAGEAEGKIVDRCKDDAKQQILVNENLAKNESETCVENAKKTIHNNFGFIATLISTAQALSSELDNVFLNCHDSEIRRMESCIIGQLARAEGALRILQSDSIDAEITVVPVTKNVIMQTSNCIRQAYSVTYSGGVVVRLGVVQCIQKAPLKPPPPTPSPTPTPSTSTPTPKPSPTSCPNSTTIIQLPCPASTKKP